MEQAETVLDSIAKIISECKRWTRGEQLGAFAALRVLLDDLQKDAKDNPPKDPLHAMEKLVVMKSDLRKWFELDHDGGFGTDEYTRRIHSHVASLRDDFLGK